jgi:hypothetical protein
VAELQKTLAALIPHIISVVYNHEGSDNELSATVLDIRDKQQLLSNGRRRRRSSAVKLQGALRRQIAHPKTHRQGVPPVSAGTESCSSDTMGV